MKSLEQRKARLTNHVGLAWSAIFETLARNLESTVARRIANIMLACTIAGRPNDGWIPSLCDIKEISELLGDPIDLQPSMLEACRATLYRISDHQARYEGWEMQLDGWIEAFQASDPARKSLGAFATPTVFADALAEVTISQDKCSLPRRVIDPAAGTGALLLAAHRRLVSLGVEREAASLRLYGVEFDRSSRELCVVLLWVAGGGGSALLRILATNIECGDALQVPWSEREPFDVLLMNPPWESLRHARLDPAMEQARTSALDRLENPKRSDMTLPPLFTSQGRGDRNLAKMFIELAPHLLCHTGRFGAVLPAAFGSDDGMADLRRLLFKHMALDRWTTFENTKRHFNIDSRYKFGLLAGCRSDSGTTVIEVRAFCSDPKETKSQHVRLEDAHIVHIGGPDRMIPEVVSGSERDTIACALHTASSSLMAVRLAPSSIDVKWT
jgi:predicted RNA methylase